MWSRFTERARKIIFNAQEEAAAFGEGYVSTEHILLGLLHEDGHVARRTLDGMLINVPELRDAIRAQLPRGDVRPVGDMTLTPRAKRVIDLAYDESRNLNNNYIGSEHLLLGLIREADGLAGRTLKKFGVELAAARREIIAQQDGAGNQSGKPLENVMRLKAEMTWAKKDADGHYLTTRKIAGGIAHAYASFAFGIKCPGLTSPETIIIDRIWMADICVWQSAEARPILKWESSITYPQGWPVTGPDGKIYTSVQELNVNHNPTTDRMWWALTRTQENIKVAFHPADGECTFVTADMDLFLLGNAIPWDSIAVELRILPQSWPEAVRRFTFPFAEFASFHAVRECKVPVYVSWDPAIRQGPHTICEINIHFHAGQ